MRKYISEFALNVIISKKIIIAPDAIKDIPQDVKDYHLYAILLEDKMYLDPQSITKTKKNISFKIFSISNGQQKYFILHNLVLHDKLNHNKINIVSEYPYDKFKIQIFDKKFLSFNENPFDKYYVSVSDFYTRCSHYMNFEPVYKILYIGQSYGKTGEVHAVKRLSNHSTLQKILAKSQSDYSQYNIKILLMEVKTLLGMTFDGISKKYKLSSEDDDEHIKKIIKTEKKEKQIINITEAALINYFKPEYNSTFKENFPNDKHSSYHQYYDLDFNSITIELNMKFENTPYIQLYTETNKHSSEWDIIEYTFDNDSTRDSMYKIFKAPIN